MKNRYKKHARKKRAKIWKLIKKMIQKWSQNPSKITSKIDATKGTKKKGLKLYKPGINLAWRNARRPQTQSFQKTSFGVKCEENKRRKPTKGWVQKWSAKKCTKGMSKKASADRCKKCKCRKASADREPTTDPNTLGGQRPRADSIAYAHSAWPGFRVASFDKFYQSRTKMGSKSTTNGTNLGQGGEGATENQQKYKNI